MEQDKNLLNIKKSVSIKPLKSGGSNFKTHILVKKKTGVLEFVPSMGLIAFLSVFFIIGSGFLVFAIYKLFFSQDYSFEFSHLIFGLIPIVFLIFSLLMGYENFKPNQFNKLTNRYIKGTKRDIIKKNTIDIPLSKIIAIQLIGEVVTGNDSSYNSFELNIVMDDGKRFNVIDQGNLKSLIRDAKWLSEFLNVPIWHAEPSNALTNKRKTTLLQLFL